MGIFTNIQASWKQKTTAEKCKFVLDLMVSVGCGAVGAKIGLLAGEGHGLFTRICTGLAGVALGGAITEPATKTMDELVDTIANAHEKAQEAQKEAANA